MRPTLLKAVPIMLVGMIGSFNAIADTWSSLDGDQVEATKPKPVAVVSSAGISSSASQLLLTEIDSLKSEVQALRGFVEEQGYELKKLKEEQKERYLDLDRRISQLLTAESSSNVSPSAQDDGKDVYESALQLMKLQKLDEAVLSFKAFLTQYPKSELAVNAYYWLGQIYYSQANLDEARKAFTIVVNQFPQHQKSADSTYKLGVILHKLGDTQLAKKMLLAVKRDYPDSASSRFAEKYLKENF